MKVIKRIDAPGLKRRIKAARQKSGISVTQLCAKCDFTSTYWYSLISESDKGEQTIKFETLVNIAGVLGVEDCFGVEK